MAQRNLVEQCLHFSVHLYDTECWFLISVFGWLRNINGTGELVWEEDSFTPWSSSLHAVSGACFAFWF